MEEININGTRITYPCEMSIKEVSNYYKQCNDSKFNLAELEIKLADGGEVKLYPHYDTVKRLRRITGYLSDLTNFNVAKQAEARDRVAHY